MTLGHFNLANSSRLAQALWQRFDFLAQQFLLDVQPWKLERLYKVPVALTDHLPHQTGRWIMP